MNSSIWADHGTKEAVYSGSWGWWAGTTQKHGGRGQLMKIWDLQILITRCHQKYYEDTLRRQYVCFKRERMLKLWLMAYTWSSCMMCLLTLIKEKPIRLKNYDIGGIVMQRQFKPVKRYSENKLSIHRVRTLPSTNSYLPTHSLWLALNRIWD